MDIWAGGEGEAGSCRSCRPETPARHSKQQAAPVTQGGGLLCAFECVSGSQKKVTRHGRAVGEKASEAGQSFIMKGNKTSSNPRVSKAASRAGQIMVWTRSDGRTRVLY